MNEWMGGWVHEWLDGWLVGWMTGTMDGYGPPEPSNMIVFYLRANLGGHYRFH